MIDKISITKVCIDDFAMKKRNTYGTVMVDIETKNVIDLLGSRELTDVIKWLKSYPNLKIVSRDGSQTYAAAIRKAHPKALQISDRFHLLKNLTDYCKTYITKTMNFKIKIQKLLQNDEDKSKNINISTKKNIRIKHAQAMYSQGMDQNQISKELKMDIRTVKKYMTLKPNDLGFKEKDLLQINHDKTVSKKEISINMVRNLSKDGYGIHAISRETGLSRQTIRRYLNPNTSAVHGSYGTSRDSNLNPFHSKIDALITKGCSFKKIEEYIKLKGYTGSSSAIRMYTTRKIRLTNQVIQSNISEFELIDRKYIIKLLYKPIDKVNGISMRQLEKVNEEYPILQQIYKLLISFKEILFSKTPNKLNSWIENAKAFNISEINSFVNGITRDLDGVKNSIIFDYSNGLAEGSVNKIKVIKRIMYGRCSFETLRRKILSLEKFRKPIRRFN